MSREEAPDPSPNTPQEWLEIALERIADAEAIHKHNPNAIGAVYMAGYGIECSLKALLQKKGIPFPSSGKEGHNLKGLWKASKFQCSDLRDDRGTQTYFLEQWSTNLRYETCLPDSLGLEITELMQGARKLNGLIRTQVSRTKSRLNR